MSAKTYIMPSQPAAAGQSKCGQCGLRQLCLPLGLDQAGMERLETVIVRRRRVQRDERLFRLGQPFHSLYAVHYGHIKTCRVDRQGAQQITGFTMAGELLGLDAIATGEHSSDAIALEDSEVCEIPYAGLGELIAQVPALLTHFHRLMSQEILREQAVMLFLGNMRAEQRLAVFLLNLATRYAQRGYSARSFQLRMSREDIGNYLGLTIESISRLMARFRQSGWIRLDNRELEILDRDSLEALATGMSSKAQAAVPAPEPAAPQRIIPLRSAA